MKIVHKMIYVFTISFGRIRKIVAVFWQPKFCQKLFFWHKSYNLGLIEIKLCGCTHISIRTMLGRNFWKRPLIWPVRLKSSLLAKYAHIFVKLHYFSQIAVLLWNLGIEGCPIIKGTSIDSNWTKYAIPVHPYLFFV